MTRYLVDPASSNMLVSKIKPCMSKNKPQNGESANDYRPLKMKQQWQMHAEWTAARVDGHHRSDV